MNPKGYNLKYIPLYALGVIVLIGGLFFILRNQISADTLETECISVNEKGELLKNRPAGIMQPCGTVIINLVDNATVDPNGPAQYSPYGALPDFKITIRSKDKSVSRTVTSTANFPPEIKALPVNARAEFDQYSVEITNPINPLYDDVKGVVTLKKVPFVVEQVPNYTGTYFYRGQVRISYILTKETDGRVHFVPTLVGDDFKFGEGFDSKEVQVDASSTPQAVVAATNSPTINSPSSIHPVATKTPTPRPSTVLSVSPSAHPQVESPLPSVTSTASPGVKETVSQSFFVRFWNFLGRFIGL